MLPPSNQQAWRGPGHHGGHARDESQEQNVGTGTILLKWLQRWGRSCTSHTAVPDTERQAARTRRPPCRDTGERDSDLGLVPAPAMELCRHDHLLFLLHVIILVETQHGPFRGCLRIATGIHLHGRDLQVLHLPAPRFERAEEPEKMRVSQRQLEQGKGGAWGAGCCAEKTTGLGFDPQLTLALSVPFPLRENEDMHTPHRSREDRLTGGRGTGPALRSVATITSTTSEIPGFPAEVSHSPGAHQIKNDRGDATEIISEEPSKVHY